MVKFKLINIDTKEEHLCDKVTKDGFDYYVSDKSVINSDNLWVVSKRNNYLGKTFYPKNDGTVTDDVIKNFLLSVEYKGHYTTTVGDGSDCDLAIATNNPDIDIPKVMDEVERLAFDYYEQVKRDYYSTGQKAQLPKSNKEFQAMGDGFIEGYNKSKETHPFSEEDVRFMLSESFKASYEGYQITSDEIIRLCKEQRPKILYYR